MGLSGPRKKTKISHDPNNTKWARSTSGFGHKIMSAQGWTPGGRLGARDAAHADLLTAASHSHIKVTIKDDTLGLGARVGRENEPTGLDAFKGLLGRLNGKSDVELKEDQRKRDNVKLARYVALKFPEVRFVRGGLLAQEKLEALPAAKPQKNQDNNKKKKKSDGNDTGSDSDDTSSDSSISVRKPTKSKSKSKSKSQSNFSKKSTKKPSKKSRSRSDNDDVDEDSSSPADSTKKEKSKKRKAGTDESSEPPEPQTQTIAAVTRERKPIGRQLFRSRHIAQKKKALMDDKSLNEIFMVKAKA